MPTNHLTSPTDVYKPSVYNLVLSQFVSTVASLIKNINLLCLSKSQISLAG